MTCSLKTCEHWPSSLYNCTATVSIVRLSKLLTRTAIRVSMSNLSGRSCLPSKEGVVDMMPGFTMSDWIFPFRACRRQFQDAYQEINH